MGVGAEMQMMYHSKREGSWTYSKVREPSPYKQFKLASEISIGY